MAYYPRTDGNLAIKLDENPYGEYKKRAIVFGGLGFIGHWVTSGLLSRGYDVTVVDNSSDYDTFDRRELDRITQDRTARIKGAEIIHGDVNNHEDMKALMFARQPDAVVYLAAFPSAKTVNKNFKLASATMTSALVNIANLAATLKSHFTFYSSSMVYGEWTVDVVDETHATNPNSLYGILKLTGEQLLKTIIDKDNLLIFRPSGAYGPYDVTDRVVSRMLFNAHHGMPLEVAGADTKLDFVYVDDLQRVTCDGIIGHKSGIYNVSINSSATLLELAKLVLDITGSKCFINIKDRHPLYPNRGTLSNAKLRQDLGFSVAYNLPSGIAAYNRWLLSRKTLELVSDRRA